MSKAAKKLIISEDDHITYGIIGADTCMGDHKVRRNCLILLQILKKNF